MAVNFPFSQPIVPANAVNWREDFHAPSNAVRKHWGLNLGGTSSGSVPADTSGAHYGRYTLSVSTAGTGSARLRSNRGISAPTPFFLLWQTALALSNLSDGTDRFYVQLGFTDTGSTSVLPPNGYGFRYSDNINSGKWECFSVSGGVSTLVDSAQLAVTSKNTFRMYSASRTGPIVFLVNDRLVASIADNIPTVDNMQAQISIFKQIGGNARTITFDYAGLYYVRPDL